MKYYVVSPVKESQQRAMTLAGFPWMKVIWGTCNPNSS